MTLKKKLAGLATGAVLAASLGGCVAVQDVVSTQVDLIGDVEVSFRLCANDESESPHPGCKVRTDQAEADDTATPGHALVGLRVPAGTTAPDSFSGRTNDPDATVVAFARSPDYESALERLAPAGSGYEWIGFRSALYRYEGNTVAARDVVVKGLRLRLPRGAAPFPSPFKFELVAGAQKEAGDRSVACGGVCIDYRTALYSQPVTDVAIVPGRATLSPGQKVDLPFDARVNNGLPLPDGTAFSVTAATSIPGVAVKPSLTSVTAPARVRVPVAIPRAAGPGTFDVSVTARLPNGQARTGTAKVTIRDRQKPKLRRAGIKPRRFKPSRRARKGANVSYTVSEAATVRGAVQRCVRMRAARCDRFRTLKGSLTRKSPAGRDVLHVTGYLRGKRLRAGTYRLVLRPIDLVGNRGAAVRVAFVIVR